MTRLRVPLLLIAALLVALAPAGPAAGEHDCPPAVDPQYCQHQPDPTPTPTQEPEPEPEPEPQPTPEPQPDPTPEPQPQPQPQPDPDPTAAPTRDTSPNRTTTSGSTPRPTADPDGTPGPTPSPLETTDPGATPEILVQGPVLDDSSDGDDEERLDVAQGAAEHEGSSGWAFFLVGFLLGGGIGWVGRGIRSMRRRRKQQLFG